jgi:succinyl-CoA synthetase alpha subunit
MPGFVFKGTVGIVSKSGTLTYKLLTKLLNKVRITTAIGGGDQLLELQLKKQLNC